MLWRTRDDLDRAGTVEDSRIRALLPQAAFQARGPSGRIFWVTLGVRSALVQRILGLGPGRFLLISFGAGSLCCKHASPDHRSGQEASKRKSMTPFPVFSYAHLVWWGGCHGHLGAFSFHRSVLSLGAGFYLSLRCLGWPRPLACDLWRHALWSFGWQAEGFGTI